MSPLHPPAPPPPDAAGILRRRDALRGLTAGMLLALGRWPGALQARDAPPPPGGFRFILVNDTHYMSAECEEWLGRAVSRMRAEQPAFILHAGDLVERGHRDHLLVVRRLFAAAGVPCYFQIGNHDHLDEADRSSYLELFPDRINYAFEHGGWQFLGLDTCEGARSSNVTISAATLQWLEAALPRIDRVRPLVVFTHFPLAEGIRYRPQNAEALLSLLLPFNLQAVLCGHYHAATERALHHAAVCTHRCCALKRNNHDGSPEKGFVVCDARGGRLTRRFVAVT